VARGRRTRHDGGGGLCVGSRVSFRGSSEGAVVSFRGAGRDGSGRRLLAVVGRCSSAAPAAEPGAWACGRAIAHVARVLNLCASHSTCQNHKKQLCQLNRPARGNWLPRRGSKTRHIPFLTMAQDGTRIPAWRRLGLALQNETQPGAAATDSTASLNATPQGRPTAVQDSVNSPTEPAQDGNSSKLGKRKHQHVGAEDEDQAPKKSKQSHGVAAASSAPAATASDQASPRAEIQTTARRRLETPTTETRKQSRPTARRRNQRNLLPHLQSRYPQGPEQLYSPLLKSIT
jgi:hypothetical protein